MEAKGSGRGNWFMTAAKAKSTVDWLGASAVHGPYPAQGLLSLCDNWLRQAEINKFLGCFCPQVIDSSFDS
jgi:hypothetical protein